MRIITILGSPRKRGNTATVLAVFERLAAADHQVERVNITDHVVAGCLGCDACQDVPDEPGCAQADDAEAILKRIAASDAVVYATPVYVWCFPAQLKALMDRHYCLVKWRDGRVASALLEGKRAALLVTCGGAAASNADLIQEVFVREMRYLRCRAIGTYLVPNCSIPGQLDKNAEPTARRMFDELVGRGAPPRTL